MSKRFLVGAALALVSGGSPLAQPTDKEFEAIELSDGIYMFEGQLGEGMPGFGGGNFALLTGSDGVILIDDASEVMAANVLRAVQALTEQPVDYVINTHVHGDHIGANAAFNETGATIITHDNIRHSMIEDSAAVSALPEVTFSDAVTFHLNGHTAYVFHVPSAHTDGDAVVHFPEANVIVAGDILFNGVFPFIDLDRGGTVSGFLAAQEKILSMADADTKIASGHGPLANKSDLQAAHDMLLDAHDRVKSLVDAGKSEDDTVAADPLASYAAEWDWFFINSERMTRALYRSLTENN